MNSTNRLGPSLKFRVDLSRCFQPSKKGPENFVFFDRRLGSRQAGESFLDFEMQLVWHAWTSRCVANAGHDLRLLSCECMRLVRLQSVPGNDALNLMQNALAGTWAAQRHVVDVARH